MGTEITISNLWQQEVKSVFAANKFDLLDWVEVQQALPETLRDNRDLALQMGGEPLREAFWAMYKTAPQLNPAPGLELLGQIFAAAMETPGYEALRQSAKGDLVAAGIAGQCFGRSLAEVVPPELQRQMKTSAQAATKLGELLQQMSELETLMAEMGTGEESQTMRAQILAAHTALGEKSETQKQAQQTAQEAAEQLLEQNKASMVNQLNQSAKKAAHEVDGTMDFVRGFSEAAGGEPGRADLATISEAMRLLYNNPQLKQLGEFLGWAKRSTRAARRKVKRGLTELTGYKTKELQPAHLASWEYAAMVSQNQMVKVDFLSRVADGGVYHRHYTGEEQKHKGGMVIVRDESGSMSGAPHCLAVAVEWALLEMARKEKRPFFSVPFSYHHHVWDAQTATVETIFEHLEHFYDSTTKPWPALITALNLIDAGDMTADILFLTDEAFGRPTAEFKKALAAAKLRRPVKIIAVIVGARRSGEVDWADKVIPLTDLVAEKERLSEVFDFMF